MKHKLLFRLCLASVAAFIGIMLFSCENTTTPVIVHNDNNNGTGNISGKVLNSSNVGISGVEVTAGNQTAYTDSKGIFFLTNVAETEKAVVSFKMSGYATTQKVTPVKRSRTSSVEATLLTYVSLNLNAVNGGSLDFNGAKAQFQANSIIDSKGNAFKGTAQVRARYFDPTSAQFYGCFPGEFKGIRTDNSETTIESFGFINLEIWNGTEKLQLAPGKPATITYPIPASLLAKAPATIPLWYFDEIKGSWMEEGVATKTGSNYVGTVKHFSSWNCDQPTVTSFLEGKVVNKNGNVMSFAKVRSTGNDYTGQSTVYTKDDGTFKIAVKSSSSAKVWASYYIYESTKQDYSTPATGLSTDIGTLTVPVDTMDLCTITGRVVDNGGFPVLYATVNILDSNGKALDHFYISKDGRFKFFGELGVKYSIEIVVGYNSADSTTNKKKVDIVTSSQAEVMDLGDIQVDIGGTTIIGRAVDSTNTPLKYVNVVTAETGSNQRENGTDSTGKFSLWVRPEKDVKITFYYQKLTKTMTVTSGKLGETKDIGDVIIP